jgi:hypothetical protein
MPIFHFNIVDDVSVLDKIGLDLRDQDQAIRHAKRLANALKDRGPKLAKPLKVVTTDNTGEILFECPADVSPEQRA